MRDGYDIKNKYVSLLTIVSDIYDRLKRYTTMDDKQTMTEMENSIIDAARRVFIKKGYVAASMGDIAIEAGIGRTTLNYYFRTKERLFESVFEQLMNYLLPNIGSIIEEEGSFWDKLEKIVSLYIDTIKTFPGFPAFIIGELNRDPDHLYRVLLKNPQKIKPVLKLQELVETNMKEGRIRKMPIVFVVSTFLGLAIFPFLVETPLTDLFFKDNKEAFDRFTQERKRYIVEIMKSFLHPQK